MEYEKWDEVLAPYNNAVEELKVKFKNIRKEFLTKGEYSPIEFVTGRTKKIASIVSKAKRLNIQDIEAEMEDIAGIRIMCQFVEDIYNIVNLIKSRSDMSIVYEKDYIKISHIVVGSCGCMLLRQPVGRESIRFCFS